MQVCWGVQEEEEEEKEKEVDSEGASPALHSLACLSLPASKHRWVTAASLFQPPSASASSSHCWTIVCGDRRGSIHVYLVDSRDEFTLKVHVWSRVIVITHIHIHVHQPLLKEWLLFPRVV